MVIRHGHGPSPQADRDAGVTVKNHVIEAIRLNKYEAADVLRKTVQEEMFCPTMKNPEFQTRKNLSVNRRTSRPPRAGDEPGQPGATADSESVTAWCLRPAPACKLWVHPSVNVTLRFAALQCCVRSGRLTGPMKNMPAENRPRLPSQIELNFLSVPEMQSETHLHDAMDHDAFSRGGGSSSVKSASLDRDSYVLVNYISPEAYALLAAAEESAARCADAMDVSVANLEASNCDLTPQSAAEGCRDSLRTLTSMAPPRKFYRIFWQSMSLRLLHRWTQEAKASRASFVPMVA
jgi:hypothetical protein